MAYYYNKNMQTHGGHLEGVVDLKEVPEQVWGTLTRDFEFGIGGIQERPWQTEACIGNWHYNRTLLTNHGYQKASSIIPLFVDIVSKNGNLPLSVPLPGHGQPDSDELAFLSELTGWQLVNGDAIKSTHPWNMAKAPSTKQGRHRPTSSRNSSSTIPTHDSPRRARLCMPFALAWPKEGTILINRSRKTQQTTLARFGK